MTIDMVDPPRPGIICVFAKAPLAGKAKTRLMPALGPEGAARLAATLLADTLWSLRELSWCRLVLAADGALELHLPAGAPAIWPQPEGELGVRLEQILRRALAGPGGAPWAVALGADSPGLPASRLLQARQALEGGHEAVLGPAQDGGFYLLGLRSCPHGLLQGLPWSSPRTLDATVERLRGRGVEPLLLAPWFDVDTPADLQRLVQLLRRGQLAAPATARLLGTLGLLSDGAAP